jgi:ATP-dependent DNA helicase RecG
MEKKMTNDLIEKRTLELKQAFNLSFLKTVSAFANYGDGEIIFGVSDDGNVVGVDNMMELKLKIENSINDAIEPRPNFSFNELSLSDKNVLVLKVFRGDSQPYFYKSKAYQRMDTASVPIDRLALQKLVMVGTQKDFDEMPSKQIELEFKTLSKWMNNVLGVQSLTEDVLISIGFLDRGQFKRFGCPTPTYKHIECYNISCYNVKRK